MKVRCVDCKRIVEIKKKVDINNRAALVVCPRCLKEFPVYLLDRKEIQHA